MMVQKYFSVFLFLILITLLAGCSKENSVQTTDQNSQATDDAAVSIAGAIATNNGGLLDQVQDILNTPTSAGIVLKTSAEESAASTGLTASYDSLTGWWTDSLSRSKTGPMWTSQYSRVYKHQFLNKNGAFQKRYITSSDTAYTVNHQIISGSDVFSNLWLSHTLKSLTAKWTGTGVNTSLVTINTTEPYTRAFTDTVTRLNSRRTLDGTLTVNFVNVVGPRGSGLEWYKKVSGTVSGHYHALVTFLKGTSYNEKTIDRDFNIVFGDSLKINVGGNTYYPDVATGNCGL